MQLAEKFSVPCQVKVQCDVIYLAKVLLSMSICCCYCLDSSTFCFPGCGAWGSTHLQLLIVAVMASMLVSAIATVGSCKQAHGIREQGRLLEEKKISAIAPFDAWWSTV